MGEEAEVEAPSSACRSHPRLPPSAKDAEEWGTRVLCVSKVCMCNRWATLYVQTRNIKKSEIIRPNLTKAERH